MRQLLSGAIAAMSLTAALHFAAVARRTGNSFYGLFAVAFALFGANSVALGLTPPESELRVALYGVRLAGFCTILVAIWRHNRG